MAAEIPGREQIFSFPTRRDAAQGPASSSVRRLAPCLRHPLPEDVRRSNLYDVAQGDLAKHVVPAQRGGSAREDVGESGELGGVPVRPGRGGFTEIPDGRSWVPGGAG